jgi:hypothetical protein
VSHRIVHSVMGHEIIDLVFDCECGRRFTSLDDYNKHITRRSSST